MNSNEKPRRSVKDRGGFTLIETIIALVILSIGILAVATLSSTSIWAVRRGQDLTNAALAAQQVMEGISNAPYDSVVVGKYSDTITMGDIDYLIVWSVEDLTEELEARNAEIKGISLYASGGALDTRAEVYEMTIYKPVSGS